MPSNFEDDRFRADQ